MSASEHLEETTKQDIAKEAALITDHKLREHVFRPNADCLLATTNSAFNRSLLEAVEAFDDSVAGWRRTWRKE